MKTPPELLEEIMVTNRRIKIANTSDIPQGQARKVTLENGEEIALFHVGEKFYALKNACPHQGGPLSLGDIEGDTVVCPWHNWQFDLSDGTCIVGLAEGTTTYKIEIDQDSIYLCE